MPSTIGAAMRFETLPAWPKNLDSEASFAASCLK